MRLSVLLLSTAILLSMAPAVWAETPDMLDSFSLPLPEVKEKPVEAKQAESKPEAPLQPIAASPRVKPEAAARPQIPLKATSKVSMDVIKAETEVAATETVSTPTNTTPHVAMNAIAPQFALARAKGGFLSLRQVLARNPALIIFVNGATFKDNVAVLDNLQANMQKFRQLGVRVLVIAPDTIDTLHEVQLKKNYDFDLLADNSYLTSTQYGRVEMKTPMPALFTISQDGRMVGLQLRQSFDYNEATAPLRPKPVIQKPLVPAPAPVPVKAVAMPPAKVLPPQIEAATAPMPTPVVTKIAPTPIHWDSNKITALPMNVEPIEPEKVTVLPDIVSPTADRPAPVMQAPLK